MRIAKVVIVGVLVISLLCIGYIYFFKDEKEERASFVNKEKNLSEESQHFVKNIDDSSSSSKGKKIDVVAQHPALNMTGEQFDKIMKAGLENGVVYTSMNEFDDVTKNAIKQALENLNEKGSLSGGIKVKEFSDLDKARENLREKPLEKMINDLDGFKSTPNTILEKYDLKLTGAQNFGSYNNGEGWSGIYKLYENSKSKVEIEQINLKPERSTQQLIKESLNTSLINDVPAVYEELSSDLIQKLTFVSDRNYYQINYYNLSKNEAIEIANSIIANPKK